MNIEETLRDLAGRSCSITSSHVAGMLIRSLIDVAQEQAKAIRELQSNSTAVRKSHCDDVSDHCRDALAYVPGVRKVVHIDPQFFFDIRRDGACNPKEQA